MSDQKQSQGASPLSGIGSVEPKTPMERIRQIQQLQEAAAAQETQHTSAPPAPVETHAPAEVHQPPAAHVGDNFAAKAVNAVKAELSPKVDRAIAAVAARQVDANDLFGGNKIEIKGNPWKVISFADGLPALFDPPKPMANYEPVVPKNAVKTDQGLLFQVALKAKDNSEQPLVKTVLTTLEGKLKGAEVSTPKALEKLLTQAPGFFESLFGFAPPKALPVRAGTQSRYEADIARPAKGGQPAKTEKALFNNFGQLVSASKDFAKLDFVHAYHLDEFEAGF
ncbi:MAG: hypothetical protein QM723_20745 [Myxococcaceae bacterium]